MGVNAQRVVSVSQTRVGEGVTRVPLDGPIEILNTLLQVLLSSFVPEIDSSEVSFMGLRIDGTGTRQAGLVLRRQLGSDLAGDVSSDAFLQRQNVTQVALVSLGPQMPVAGSLNQLRRDPD